MIFHSFFVQNFMCDLHTDLYHVTLLQCYDSQQFNVILKRNECPKLTKYFELTWWQTQLWRKWTILYKCGVYGDIKVQCIHLLLLKPHHHNNALKHKHTIHALLHKLHKHVQSFLNRSEEKILKTLKSAKKCNYNMLLLYGHTKLRVCD